MSTQNPSPSSEPPTLHRLGNAEPLAVRPHFHLSMNVDNVNLPALNDSLMAYVGVDVGRGTFRMAAEMAGFGAEPFEDRDLLRDGHVDRLGPRRMFAVARGDITQVMF